MHNYHKIHIVLRTNPNGKCLSLCLLCYVLLVKSQQPKEFILVKPRFKDWRNGLSFLMGGAKSHTAKRSAFRDEKNVLPFWQVNTFQRHKGKCGRIHGKLMLSTSGRICKRHIFYSLVFVWLLYQAFISLLIKFFWVEKFSKHKSYNDCIPITTSFILWKL